MNARTLLREVEGLEARSPSRGPEVPEDRVEFARRAGFDALDGWQEEALRSDARRVILNVSRQAGKSSLAALVGLHTALSRPGALVLALSPSERQSKELFAKMAGFYRRLGEKIPADSHRKLGAEFANGSRIEALPGSERTVRGFSGVDLLLVDEAARTLDELYQATRPMLAASGGSLWLMSTPYGKRGFFHREWTEGAGWRRFEMKAAECPRIPPEFLEEERLALPARVYRQEYECSFEETDDAVFAFEDVAGAMSEEVAPLFGNPISGNPLFGNLAYGGAA